MAMELTDWELLLLNANLHMNFCDPLGCPDCSSVCRMSEAGRSFSNAIRLDVQGRARTALVSNCRPLMKLQEIAGGGHAQNWVKLGPQCLGAKSCAKIQPPARQILH